VVTSDNSLQNRLVTRSGMGFEMSNDGGAAGSTGGGNGGSGVNAYGAAPPPAPPGGLLVPNALGGQAQPVIVSDAEDGAALASPDALDSKVETGTGSNYARIYVTDSTSGAIAYTNRLGAVPSNALPEEPLDLTKPGSLGYVASTGSSAVPAARIDTLFNENPGIYDYTVGQHYSRVKGDMGLKVDNDVILVVGADGSGDLDISSGGQTRIYAKNGPIYLFSGGAINIDAIGDVNIKTKASATTTVAGESKVKISGDDTATVYSNSRKHTWGASTDFFMGSRNQFNFSVGLTFNLGFIIAFTAGLSFSMFLTSRITLILGPEIKIVLGPDLKVETADYKLTTFKTNLEAIKVETGLINLMAKALDVETKGMEASREALEAKQKALEAEQSSLKSKMVLGGEVEMTTFKQTM
jgi:hypothetical protein